MTKDEYVALLQALGHFNAALVRKVNGGFYVECECGYRSTHRNTAQLGIQAMEHHRQKVIREARANGRVLPGSAAARL